MERPPLPPPFKPTLNTTSTGESFYEPIDDKDAPEPPSLPETTVVSARTSAASPPTPSPSQCRCCRCMKEEPNGLCPSPSRSTSSSCLARAGLCVVQSFTDARLCAAPPVAGDASKGPLVKKAASGFLRSLFSRTRRTDDAAAAAAAVAAAAMAAAEAQLLSSLTSEPAIGRCRCGVHESVSVCLCVCAYVCRYVRECQRATWPISCTPGLRGSIWLREL